MARLDKRGFNSAGMIVFLIVFHGRDARHFFSMMHVNTVLCMSTDAVVTA